MSTALSGSTVALTYSSLGKTRFTSGKTAQPMACRDKLVMDHAEMVRRVALHMANRLDGAVDPDCF